MRDPLDPCGVNSLIETPGANPVEGRVVWDPVHSLWNGGMLAAALVLGPMTFSWPGLAFAVALAALSMLGFSVGLHRQMAHGAFRTGKNLRRLLAWAGALTGIDGPLGMVRAHHLSDWAQHQPRAHDFFTHRRGLLRHWLWRAHGRIVLNAPPAIPLTGLTSDPVLRWMERTWMLQQAPVALALYLIGGWPLVVWGVPVRVTATVTGYWVLAHLAHRPSPGRTDAGTPGNGLRWAAVLTLGEAWHDNHHAFPESARIGLHPGQSDLGFRFIQLLERLGLAWDVRTPATTPKRGERLEAGR